MSLSFVIIPEMVPATRYAIYGSITSFTFAIAYLLGPLIGGVINEHTTWRWVFLLKWVFLLFHVNPGLGVVIAYMVLVHRLGV